MTSRQPAEWIATLDPERRGHLFTAAERTTTLSGQLNQLAGLLQCERGLLDPCDVGTWTEHYTALSTHAHAMSQTFADLATSWADQAEAFRQRP